MIPDIFIIDGPTTDENAFFHIYNVTPRIYNWRQISRAIGGHYEATFDIKDSKLNLRSFYRFWIGKKIQARVFGLVAWEGIITQLDLIEDGFNYRISLEPAWWHNKIKVTFRSTISSPVFSGGGTDDMLVGGAYTLSENLTYTICIDGTGSPNTFKWSDGKSSFTDQDTWRDLQSGGGANDELAVQTTLQTTDNVDGNITEVKLYLKRTGSPGGNLNVSIQDNSGGLPNSEISNGGSGTVSADSISTSGEWVSFTFSTNPLVSDNTIYHIVLQADATYTYSSGVDEVSWGTTTVGSGGTLEAYNGSNWNNVTTEEATYWLEGDLDSTWNEETVSITANWQSLNSGIQIKFGATTGHVLEDEWVFTATEEAIQANTAWASNSDSIAIYGTRELIITLGEIYWGQARVLRDTHLNEFAWPRSRLVGNYTIDETKKQENVLRVKAQGFWETLNWEYFESSQVDTDIESILSYLIGEAQFVIEKRIESNAVEYQIKATGISQRFGDIIEDAILTGDSVSTLYRGGVYEDKGFIYEESPDTVDYYIFGKTLVDKGGVPVIGSLLKPGFLVKDANAPTGPQPPGDSNVWDDPTVGYVEEVIFEAPDKISLKFYDSEESVVLLEKKFAESN